MHNETNLKYTVNIYGNITQYEIYIFKIFDLYKT